MGSPTRRHSLAATIPQSVFAMYPGHVRDHHGRADHRCCRRADEVLGVRRLRRALGDPRLQPARPLGLAPTAGSSSSARSTSPAARSSTSRRPPRRSRCALVLGKRKGYGKDELPPAQPAADPARRGHPVVRLVRLQRRLGARAPTASRARAFLNTNLAAAAALLAWLQSSGCTRGKPTALGAASGAVAGLVGITPAAGFVEPMGRHRHRRHRRCRCATSGSADQGQASASTTRSTSSASTASAARSARSSPACSRRPPSTRSAATTACSTATRARCSSQLVGVVATLAFSFVLSYRIAQGHRHDHRIARRRGCRGPRARPRRARGDGLHLLARSAAVRVPSGTGTRITTDGPRRIDMKKIEAIIKPHKLDDVKEALNAARRGRDDRDRGPGFRAPEGPHRDLPRLRVHGRLRAQGQDRDRRGRRPRRASRARHRRWPPAPRRSATARSSPTTSAARAHPHGRARPRRPLGLPAERDLATPGPEASGPGVARHR